ncbi:MAG TPA: TIGR04076 family protein [Anaerolineae bacterium]|nr:TIGR04076 family protein [Anaerolineae bacterium]
MASTGHPIEMRAVEIRERGTCPLDIKVGDLFRSEGEVGAVWHWAAHTLLPLSTALRFDEDILWELEPGLVRVCCPDPDNSVVFEIQRAEADG